MTSTNVAQPMSEHTLEDVVIQMMPWSGATKGIRGEIVLPLTTPDGRRTIAIEIERPPVPNHDYLTCHDEGVLAAYRSLRERTDTDTLLDRFGVDYRTHPEAGDGFEFKLPSMAQRDIPAALLTFRAALESIIWCHFVRPEPRVNTARKEAALSVLLQHTLTGTVLTEYLEHWTQTGYDEANRDRESTDMAGAARAIADWLAQEIVAADTDSGSSFADDILARLQAAKVGYAAVMNGGAR